jgi:dienelactone hydrolase
LLHKIERAMSRRVQILTAACLFAGCNGPSVVQPLTEPGVAAEEAVSFRSGTVTLAGTIVRPAAATRSPAVVLFHGSGPQRRDLTTARWFAEQGILALAYDKRGVGESTGDFRAVPFTDLCDDGLAAIDLLKRRSDVDANRIGVWGLSQGGWLGPLAASRSPDVKFVIAVSGPGVSPGEQMIGDHRSDFTREGPTRFMIREFPRADHTIHVEQPDGRRVLAPDYLETTSRWLAAHGIRPAAVERTPSSRAPAR